MESAHPDDRIAVVFQSPGLFPWLSVRENIALELTVLLVTHDIQEALALGDRIGSFGGPGGFSREWVPARDGTTAAPVDVIHLLMPVARYMRYAWTPTCGSRPGTTPTAPP